MPALLKLYAYFAVPRDAGIHRQAELQFHGVLAQGLISRRCAVRSRNSDSYSDVQHPYPLQQQVCGFSSNVTHVKAVIDELVLRPFTIDDAS